MQKQKKLQVSTVFKPSNQSLATKPRLLRTQDLLCRRHTFRKELRKLGENSRVDTSAMQKTIPDSVGC